MRGPTDEVAELLRGDAASVERALVRLSQEFREGICGWLGRRFPGLGLDDLADVWQDSLLGVCSALRTGRVVSDRPLAPWLATVAWRRAVDLTRRRVRERRALEELRERSAEALVAPPRRERSEQIRDLLAAIRREVARLPERQRLVLEVFSDGYPETARMETLRRRASRAAGEELSLASVKRALQEGRRKLRRRLPPELAEDKPCSTGDRK